MKFAMKQAGIVLAAALFSACLGTPVGAEEAASAYPSKPVRILVPVVAGGAPDVMARAVADQLSASLGQPFLVVNMPGGGGLIANETAANAAPDGYTLLMGDPGNMMVTPAIRTKLSYDPLAFTAIQMIGNVPMFFVTPASARIESFAQLAAAAKARPGQLNYASSGIGSVHHLWFEMVKAQAGLDITHVPYKGSGQAAPAIAAGEVQVGLTGLPAISAFVQGGTVKILAATSRAPQMPDVPTLAEVGVKGLDLPGDIGIFGQAAMPKALVDKLSAEIVKAVRKPEVAQRLTTMGINPVVESSGSPDQQTQRFRTTLQQISTVSKSIGLQIE